MSIEFAMITNLEKLLQPQDLGWIAGILDMKGKVMKKNNSQRNTRQTVLVVETRHHDIVKRLGEYVGTNPEMQKERKSKEEWTRRGCVEHCPDKHQHVETVNMPSISRWTVTGSSLVVVVYNVLPYLTKDSQRHQDMMDAMETIASTIPLEGQGRNAIDTALSRLANLGWIIPNYVLPAESVMF